MNAASSFRLRAYPLGVLVALTAAVLMVVLTSDGESTLTGRLGGDLPEFVGAGRIVAEGDADALYDPARQAAAQADLWEDEGGGILFAYPAVLALPYAALEGFGYHVTYLVHTAVMVAAVALAARLLVDRVPILRGTAWIPAGLAVALTFLPMFIGVFNGQLTGMVLLGLVAVWVLLSDERDGWAGLLAGLMVLKPQYGLVVIGLLVLARRWTAVAAAAVGAGLVWAGSALVAGPTWHREWLELSGSLSDIDQGSNLANEVSWLGLAEATLGRGTTAALSVGLAGAAVTAVLLVVLLRGLDVADPRVPALVMPSLLLLAPHALFYDAGILLVSLAALLPLVAPRMRPLVAVAWWAVGLTHVSAAALGVEPVAALVIATWVWAAWSAHATSGVPTRSAPSNGRSLTG